jgi:hypothetical protein
MLEQEQYQIAKERQKGFGRYEPDSYFVRSGERKRLVQLLFKIGKKLDQSCLTIHLAVKLLDRVFSLLGGAPEDVSPDSYELIANGCLMLSAKFEELDMKIPLIQDLMAVSKYKLTYHQLKGVQSELITLLDFDLMAITPYHVLNNLFATGLIVSTDQKLLDNKDISERTLVKVREYAQYFCDLLAEHYAITARFPPSKVAIGCFYLARKCCMLRSAWSEDLSEYTGFQLGELKDIVNALERCKEVQALSRYAIDNFSSGGSRRAWEVAKFG